MPTVDEVTKKYIEIRDTKAEIAKRHQAELEPYNQKLSVMEAWLMDQMNAQGVQSFKTESGTPYKANSNSVRMQDALEFKKHVFLPAIEAIYHYLVAVGYSIQPVDTEAMQSLLQEKPRWDMVDFRAGKKGILEYQEQHNALPPGVTVETTSVVNVRRS